MHLHFSDAKAQRVTYKATPMSMCVFTNACILLHVIIITCYFLYYFVFDACCTYEWGWLASIKSKTFRCHAGGQKAHPWHVAYIIETKFRCESKNCRTIKEKYIPYLQNFSNSNPSPHPNINQYVYYLFQLYGRLLYVFLPPKTPYFTARFLRLYTLSSLIYTPPSTLSTFFSTLAPSSLRESSALRFTKNG